MKQKKLTSKAGITIPKDYREKVGLLPGQAVDISVEGTTIMIRRHAQTCYLCGSPVNVIQYLDKDFCRECIHEMYIRGNGGLAYE